MRIFLRFDDTHTAPDLVILVRSSTCVAITRVLFVWLKVHCIHTHGTRHETAESHITYSM